MRKRTPTLLLSFLILLSSLLPFAALADDVYPYDIGRVSIAYGVLGDDERRLFDDLYRAIRRGKSNADIPSGMSIATAWQIVDLVTQETPELIALDRPATTITTLSLFGSEKPTKVNLVYRCTIAEQDAFIASLASMVAPLAGHDDATVATSIHDFLCGQIAYDRAATESGDTTDGQRFFDALRTNKGVCNAYAQGMAALCHFAGLPASYMHGTAGDDNVRHAWNIVRVGGAFTYYDVTWDDADETGAPVSVYSGVGYERFYRSHRDDPTSVLYPRFPRGTELNTLIGDESALHTALATAVNERPAELTLRFTPQMYDKTVRSGDGLYGTLAAYGIRTDGCSLYNDGSAVVFRNCRYAETVTYRKSKGLTPGLSDLKRNGTKSFLITTDDASMRDYAAGNAAALQSALAKEGLLPGNYTLYSNKDDDYFTIENAVWQDVNVCKTESELKSLLKSARKQKAKELTVVLDLDLFGKLMAKECKKFKDVMSSCKVYGTFSYYDCGVVQLTKITY